MNVIVINGDFLKQYTGGKKRHAHYSDALKLYADIRRHADGLAPGELIAERRPGESQHTFNYRQKIYRPKTKSAVSKVLTTLGQIRRSPDWSIQYSDDVTKKVQPEDSLQVYCEEQYPVFTSLTKWYFDVCLRQQMLDPNAVAVVHPIDWSFAVQETEYIQPVITIYNTEAVLDFVPNQYAVIKTDEKCSYRPAGETHDRHDGEVYLIVTAQSYIRFKQADVSKEKWTMEDQPHTVGELPCFKLGGVLQKTGLYESRINGMVPSMDVAVSLYSDKQAEIVQHVHSEKWMYKIQQCKTCSGSGSMAKANSAPIVCPDCKGAGTMASDPYSTLILNPHDMPVGSEKQLPVPPAGYVQKTDVAEMVKVISAEIASEMYDAFSAVNMEFVMDTPLAESGKAKEVDRDAMNTFAFGVAEDAVGVLDKCYWLIALMRYGVAVGSKDDVKAMCPKIPVPEKYDLLSSSYYLERFNAARTAKLSPVLLTAMELEYVTKAYPHNEEIAEMMKLIIKLDPLPGLTIDEKMSLQATGAVTESDYIISGNIAGFVKRAIEEDESFTEKKLQEQRKIVAGYASEVMKANSVKNSIMVE